MKLEEQKKDKKKVTLVIVGVLLALCLVVGISYAYWMITKSQEGKNVLSSGCFDISLEGGKPINLATAYPITDEDGQKTTPYTFTITNTCDLFASYTVNLEMLEGTTMASKYVKVMINKEEIQNLNELETTEPVINNSTESRKLISGSLGAGDSEEYNLRLWMDGDINSDEKEAMNKQLLTKVVVKASPSNYNPVDYGITLLKDAILANEYQTTSVETAKNKIASKQSVDFTKTAPIIDWEESHSSSTSTYSVTLPNPSLVNSGIEGTEKLTATNVLPLIGTGYTFNSETGYYTLTNTQHVDPTALDYSSQELYMCVKDTGLLENENGTLQVGYTNKCDTLIKIINVSSTAGTYTSSKTKISYKTINYKMTKYEYTQNELESDKSDKGLYQINDADGTSYYYRGSVKNNYVYFGGHYWQIIRINGDGSIRLLYAGTKPTATGDDLFSTLTDSSLGYNNAKKVAFNRKHDNPAYVGYMYGNILNSSYAETHANENDSNIKKYLDSWYRQNIEEKGLSSYIADSGFCNDRGLIVGDGVSSNKGTDFIPLKRFKDAEPSLLCTNTNDLFTISSDKGNGKLSYPIGLITIDELMLSGVKNGQMNKMMYTMGTSVYWTMSPFIMNVGLSHASMFGMNEKDITGYWIDGKYGVRPVINLKADTEITGGIGTANQPFLIK